MAQLLKLPNEIIENILFNLDINSVINLSTTNKKLNYFIFKNDNLWKKYFLEISNKTNTTIFIKESSINKNCKHLEFYSCFKKYINLWKTKQFDIIDKQFSKDLCIFSTTKYIIILDKYISFYDIKLIFLFKFTCINKILDIKYNKSETKILFINKDNQFIYDIEKKEIKKLFLNFDYIKLLENFILLVKFDEIKIMLYNGNIIYKMKILKNKTNNLNIFDIKIYDNKLFLFCQEYSILDYDFLNNLGFVENNKYIIFIWDISYFENINLIKKIEYLDKKFIEKLKTNQNNLMVTSDYILTSVGHFILDENINEFEIIVFYYKNIDDKYKKIYDNKNIKKEEDKITGIKEIKKINDNLILLITDIDDGYCLTFMKDLKVIKTLTLEVYDTPKISNIFDEYCVITDNFVLIFIDLNNMEIMYDINYKKHYINSYNSNQYICDITGVTILSNEI